MPMGDLEDYFRTNKGRLITKWRHYFEIYERHFASHRGRPVRLLEYGVWQGGSLQMWRSYFGAQAEIVGVDINPECARFAEPGIDVVIGDQADPATHRGLRERYGRFDVVIDDGGHRPEHQITTFLEIYPALAPGGTYLVEDCHTSYLAGWGGGLRRPGTFIEFAKRIVDQQHAWYGPIPGLQGDELTRTAFGLHFYDSMVVIEKRELEVPVSLYSGQPTLPLDGRELESLAYMDALAGRRELAADRYRRALELLPGDENLLKRLRDLESRPA